MEELLIKGVTIIIALGGMSVDADDVTPSAISKMSELKRSPQEIETAFVLP